MPLSKHHLWGKIAGDMTGIKFIGLACLPYGLIHLLSRSSPPAFFATLQSRLFLALFFISSLSYLIMGVVPLAASHWLTYFSMVLLFFITLVVVDSLDRVRWVLLSASASLAMASLYVLRDWQTTHSL